MIIKDIKDKDIDDDEVREIIVDMILNDPSCPAELKNAVRCADAMYEIDKVIRHAAAVLPDSPKPEDAERLTQDAEILEAILEQLKGAFPEEADGEADPDPC